MVLKIKITTTSLPFVRLSLPQESSDLEFMKALIWSSWGNGRPIEEQVLANRVLPTSNGGINKLFSLWMGLHRLIVPVEDDSNLAFCSGPYFLGPQGLYLNHWMLKFNLEEDIPKMVLVWVCVLHLQQILWDDSTFQVMGNNMKSSCI